MYLVVTALLDKSVSLLLSCFCTCHLAVLAHVLSLLLLFPFCTSYACAYSHLCLSNLLIKFNVLALEHDLGSDCRCSAWSCTWELYLQLLLHMQPNLPSPPHVALCMALLSPHHVWAICPLHAISSASCLFFSCLRVFLVGFWFFSRWRTSKSQIKNTCG